MATTATHNSSRTSDESSELLEQHLVAPRGGQSGPDLPEAESSSTADFPPAERQGGIALADADETSTTEIQPSSGLGDALKAERRRSNNLEKELRGLRQQLTRFSEINPEEYARLQQAERQKQLLEQQVELRERQMEEASARKVAAVAAERDAAHERVQELRKERLMERAFSEAEGLKVRTKALTQLQAEAVLQGFERSLVPGLLLLEPEPQDFRNANACLRGWSTSLRAADALHLAIASGRGAALCSLDAPFVAAAQQLGLAAHCLGSGKPPNI